MILMLCNINMHNSCFEFCKKNILEEEIEKKSILEIGAYNVNGSMRDVILAYNPSKYIGTDIRMGKGVDIICSAENILEVYEKESFDFIICTETLEHIKKWQKAISNIKNVCVPEGIILLTTRSKGFPYHEYPNDYWRFEISDMENIFFDCKIKIIENDQQIPGVFIKVKKPLDYLEKDIFNYIVCEVTQ